MEGNRDTVLVVDDNSENRSLLNGLLSSTYRVLIATNGMQAISACQSHLPDIVLLDIMMPEMDGYEVCLQLKADPRTAHIPIIFLTAKSQIEDEQKGFDVGAVDYILKPISPPILMSRVRNHLKLKHAMEELAQQNTVLEDKVKARTHELESLQDATIGAMASLAETRDNETGNHIRRTQHYIRLLGEQLIREGLFLDQLNESTLAVLYKSAPLHDIGKVGIPDEVLLKPGKLTDEEFEIMKSHTELGKLVIETVEESIDFQCDFLMYAKEIAYSHQEKWDGSGYPQKIKGEAIPLSARMMAIADVYDALISHRVYKPAFSHEKAVSIISEGKGSHFDPRIVDSFMNIHEQFRDVAARFSDDEHHDQNAAEITQKTSAR
ncbi:response regulator [Vibrio vulnificus]|uniref:response regulator n=1 Tax=Vibrio vulnificus TaxID=672 RepID=UPI00188D8D43|nr:two-component system response regulator [Vibrio vulnificus]MBF4449200.1 two-component system response regulator [Vibrio vulnificus]MBF4495669.1 two-component system response regulator [Vibrio vulnificus]MBL6181360.1 two-component system response regulator [Vibrio vulnificus]HDY7979607.1 two-component system response regulator [Vibrio vulnificus]HDY8003068.1 two-component system response regulator [Vibrio vulnificus]